MQRYETEGLDRLCEELKLLDPNIMPLLTENPKRVIHALEICYMTDVPILPSEHKPAKNGRSIY